ncbi:MAG: GTPase [Acidimicrobiales bacterium]
MSPQLSALVERAAAAAMLRDRDDLATRVRRHLADTALDRRILVVGGYKVGKSTLVNALLGVDLCLAAADRDSELPCLVRFGATISAHLTTTDQARESAAATADHTLPVLLDDATRAMQQPPPGALGLTYTAPQPLLRSGLALLDMPGLGGHGSPSERAAIASARESVAVIFVVDGTRELTLFELDSIAAFHSVNHHLIVVASKCELTRHATTLIARNRRHLGQRGLGAVPVLGVASELRAAAVARNDVELNRMSGYPELVRAIAATVGASPRHVRVCAEIDDVVAQLREEVESERAALGDLDDARAMEASRSDAIARVQQLRSAATRWQAVLAEGSAVLASEAEFDLRQRLRRTQAWADAEIDAGDPATGWDDIARRVNARVADDLCEHVDFIEGGLARLAEKVVDHFAEADVDVSPSAGRAPEGGERLRANGLELADLDLARSGVLDKGLVALRGSYGGMMVFGFVGTALGLTILSPLAFVAGIGLGGKAVRDDRTRQVAARRAQAKAHVRRAFDELTFQQVKQTRDAVREAQNGLRSGFLARIEELQRSLTAAATAAAGAIHGETRDADQTRADLDAEWHTLERLQHDAEQFQAGWPSAARRGRAG